LKTIDGKYAHFENGYKYRSKFLKLGDIFLTEVVYYDEIDYVVRGIDGETLIYNLEECEL